MNKGKYTADLVNKGFWFTEFRKTIEGSLRKIVVNTAKAYGATATLEYEYYASPVINDDDILNEVAHDALIKLYGNESYKEMTQVMGSEDFAYYADQIPAVFGFLGSKNEELGFTASNHNDHFTVNEKILKRGAAMYAQFAFDYLEKTKE